MKTHYQTLGIQSSASADEIRRAYRILARRYHPDLNPGQLNAERFRGISEAYEVLSDASRRSTYDAQLETHQREDVSRGFAAYERAQARKRSATSQRTGTTRPQHAQRVQEASKSPSAKPEVAGQGTKKLRKVTDHFRTLLRNAVGIGASAEESPKSKSAPQPTNEVHGVARVSVIEVSISIHDAILGVKKAIEIPEANGPRKLSVSIPPGVKSGSVIRLRAKSTPGEDIVLIVRVAVHPFLSVQTRGLVAEIPVTIQEAVLGSNISVPTLDEPVSIKIPPGSQSGSEIRLKNRGILNKDGTRGDLFIRLLIKAPDAPDAVGLKEQIAALEKYYSSPVRQGFPKSLVE